MYQEIRRLKYGGVSLVYSILRIKLQQKDNIKDQMTMTNYQIIHDEATNVLRKIPRGSIDLIYIDPPFNTGKIQKLGAYS